MNPSMPSAQCPECGGPVAPSAAQGLCPRCLMSGAAEPTEPAPRAAPPPLESVIAAFAHLEVQGIIGHGGMGAVYKVRQPKLDRFAALKLLPQSPATDGAFAERFEREAKLLARLSHPNIVSVYDYGQAGGFFYLLMEFVDGVNLRQAMRTSRFTPAQALGIVPKICDALQYAHDEGVLHRDIKPENILLDAKGRVKLADFGIAKLIHSPADEPQGDFPARAPSVSGLTQAGAALGTPTYMAPEQREHPSGVDHRADIYSLGVVFYELLTGELPRDSFSPPSTKSQADPRVDAIVQQALEKERERRQRSAAEMRTQVESIHSPNHPARKRRHPPWRKLVKTVVVVLILLITVRTFFAQPFRVPTDGAAPEIPRGSHVLVWKLSRTFAPGDIVAYEWDNLSWIGRIVRSAGEEIILSQNDKPEITIPRSAIIGKVISVYWRGTSDPSALASSPPAKVPAALSPAGFAPISTPPHWMHGRWVADLDLTLSHLPADTPDSTKNQIRSLCDGVLFLIDSNSLQLSNRLFGKTTVSGRDLTYNKEKDIAMVPLPVPGGGKLTVLAAFRREGQHMAFEWNDSLGGNFEVYLRAAPEEKAPLASAVPAWLQGAWVFDREYSLAQTLRLPGQNMIESHKVIEWLASVRYPGMRMEFSPSELRSCLRPYGGATKPLQGRLESVDADTVRLPLAGASGPEPYLLKHSGRRIQLIKEKPDKSTAPHVIFLKKTDSITTEAGLRLAAKDALRALLTAIIATDLKTAGYCIWREEPAGTTAIFPDGNVPGMNSLPDWQKTNPPSRLLPARIDPALLRVLAPAECVVEFTQDAPKDVTVHRGAGKPDGRGTVRNAIISWNGFDPKTALSAEQEMQARVLFLDDLAYWELSTGSETAAAIPAVSPRIAFGPAVEKVLPFGAPCLQHYLQFSSGSVFDIGRGPDTTKEQDDEDRKKAEDAGGVDAEALGGEEAMQFAGEGCLFTKEHEPDWEKQTAENILSQLQRATWITGVIETKKSSLPATYLFKTARGESGILELIDIVPDDRGYHGDGHKGHGVKLRYKLVQPAAPR